MDVDDLPRRIPELWFDDGNIVLQAGSRQYCVYRGTLAACSPVFQDMFSFPQPPDSELVERLPAVRLQDSSSQVTLFLKAIFQPNYFMPFPATTEYSIIQACLRLGHKYGVEHLRLRALTHLSSRYRTTLREFDAVTSFDSDSEAAEDDPSTRPLSGIASWTSDSFTDDMSVILLAREVEAPWVIPVAFYRISVGLGDLIDKPASGTIFSSGLYCLGLQDQMALLRGHSLQTQASTTSILACFAQRLDSDMHGCKSTKRCLRARLAAIDTLQDTISIHPSMPLDVWDQNDWANELEDDVCSVCLAALKKKHKAARRAFWNMLPGMYELPSWAELEKLRVEAIGKRWVS